MNISEARNIGAYVNHVLGNDHYQVVAGAGLDGVAQNGRGIDRSALGKGMMLSAVVAVAISAVLAGSETASVVVQLQDSLDDAAADPYANYGSASFATVISDGADENGLLEFDIDLSGAKKWIRAVITTTMSAGATDTAEIMSSVMLAGPSERAI